MDCSAQRSSPEHHPWILALSVTEPSTDLPLKRYLHQYLANNTLTVRCESVRCFGKYPNRYDRPFGIADEGKERIETTLNLAFPEYLFIRFQHSPLTLLDPTKIESFPKYPLWLDMSEYQNDELRWNAPLRYRLNSVVYHNGRTAKSGHYYGVFTTANGIMQINDTEVKAAHIKDFFWQKDHHLGGCPYLLAYVRTHHGEKNPKQTETAQK
jgi:Ubiquitin carboxyl-terminal hydrolase